MTRKDDEQILHMLALYAAGSAPAAIARTIGASRAEVAARIRAVRDADCKHDPSARQYWRKSGDLNA